MKLKIHLPSAVGTIVCAAGLMGAVLDGNVLAAVSAGFGVLANIFAHKLVFLLLDAQERIDYLETVLQKARTVIRNNDPEAYDAIARTVTKSRARPSTDDEAR